MINLTDVASTALVCALAATATAQTDWIDALDLGVEGQAWSDTAEPYDRLPARAEETVRPPVWKLSRCATGLCLRFRSDAPEIRVRWALTSDQLEMPHMPATGVSGVDLYVEHEGAWRWLAVGQARRFPENTARLVTGLEAAERNYLLYLPLYNGVSRLSIGVPRGSTITEGPAPKHPKPIVFYGTSITQGGCASRPGMCHTAILGRRLDHPIVNLGFSGNGTMDASISALLAELDPALFVIDCLPNMNASQIRERLAPLVDTLREARPNTPILLVEDRTYQNAFLRRNAALRNDKSRAALREGYAALVARGVKGLHYLRGDALLGDDGEATVDGSHPTDLGFLRQANVFEGELRKILYPSDDR